MNNMNYLVVLLILGSLMLIECQKKTFPPAVSWAKNGIGKFETVDGKRALCLTFHKGQVKEKESGSAKLALGAAPRHKISYMVHFKDGYDFNKGGKLPGLIGGKPSSGCTKSIKDGWSARFMWGREGALNLYTYDQNREGGCGNSMFTGFKFTTGRWYKISQEVFINTPGKANGRIVVSVNDKVVFDKSNFELRGNVGDKVALVETLNFNIFYGGKGPTWAPRNDSTACFADFTQEL